MSTSPFRDEVLAMYRRIVRAAFTHRWRTDEDAMYVLHEARRLFRQNQFLTDPMKIEKKLREAEMRHALAVHYTIPYPRMYHKAQGSDNISSGAAYAPYMDSMYDTPYNPTLGRTEEGQSNMSVPGVTNAYLHPEDVGHVK